MCNSVYSYMMEKVDLVLVGAEGVVESGGIINKVSDRSLFYNIIVFILWRQHD